MNSTKWPVLINMRGIDWNGKALSMNTQLHSPEDSLNQLKGICG